MFQINIVLGRDTIPFTTTPPYRYTYRIGNSSSSKARHEVMAQGRATVPALTVAKHEGRTGHGTRHEARNKRMKQQRKKSERRTTKTNDNSKIRWQRVVTNHVEYWRRLLYFYIWIPPTIGGQGVCIGVVWSPLKIHHNFQTLLGWSIR